MKKLLTLLFISTTFLVSNVAKAQSETSEILTIVINWEPNGKNMAYISENGKPTVEKVIEGKFRENGLGGVSENLNGLLNEQASSGWELVSTFTMNPDLNIQCFIFKKDRD